MSQKEEFDHIYNLANTGKWNFHVTDNQLIRYLRDKRLNHAIDIIQKKDPSHSKSDSILIVCGGVGGEAFHFVRRGYINVTNSDFVDTVDAAGKLIFNSTFAAIKLDALNIDLPDASFDYVIVQDGLHHLNCPVKGMIEMLRVCKKGIVVIEPHTGYVGELLGTKWENIEGNINWVFRWNKDNFTQCTNSYLVKSKFQIIVNRLWDHNLAVGKVANKMPKALQVPMAKFLYFILNTFFKRMGNMFIGVVIKG